MRLDTYITRNRLRVNRISLIAALLPNVAVQNLQNLSPAVW